MGIRMRLPKTDNTLYMDFDDAYWVIENISFINDNEGDNHTRFMFNAYPSREAYKMNLHPMDNTTIQYGGPVGVTYSPLLHMFENVVRTSVVFPNGIPITQREQKDTLYSFVKRYMELTDYEDVIEDTTQA